MGVIRARCGDREMEGACSVVRLLEEGGGMETNVGNISKRAGKIIRKGEKEKGTNDDIGQGKINWTEKNTRNGEPPDWRDPRGTGKSGRKKCKEQFTGGM